jgi:hypothetical protein
VQRNVAKRYCVDNTGCGLLCACVRASTLALYLGFHLNSLVIAFIVDHMYEYTEFRLEPPFSGRLYCASRRCLNKEFD